MAVKTITIDMEAYDLLVKARRGNESFSTVIKTTLAEAGRTADALLHHLDSYRMPDDVLDEMERVVAARADDLIAAEGTEPYGS